MKFFEKLFGGPTRAGAEGVAEQSPPAPGQRMVWTKERLTDLFGQDFSKLLDVPGEEPLDLAGRERMLKRFISEIRSGRSRITDVFNTHYLDAAICTIVAKEKLLQYLKTGSEPQGSSKDLERELRDSINARETLGLALQMAEESMRNLRAG